MFTLTESPIDPRACADALGEAAAGALVTFEGWVRNHNQGQAVASLEYQVYAELAVKEGARILAEAKERFNVKGVSCVHRHGHLGIGDIAVWVGATAAHRNDAFRAARFVIDEIKHRLPIWKKEHYVKAEARWVFCRDHATHVHLHEEDYYAKQTAVADPAVLKEKRVLVVGAGGLGCPVATGLVTAGVGTVSVLDFDRVEASNLHRQPLFTTADIGEKKAVVAATRLRGMNPFVKVAPVLTRVTAGNAAELVRGYDLVLDCTDTLETKFALHDACFRERVALVSASIYRFEGQLRTFAPGVEGGCLRCLYPKPPRDEFLGNCNDFGVLGASVNALGSLQAGEALAWLLEGRNGSAASTVYFDLRALSVMKVRSSRRADCALCGTGAADELWGFGDDEWEVTAAELPAGHELVDVSSGDEESLERFVGSERPVVLVCPRGLRSRRLAALYRARGFSQFYSLAGGARALEPHSH